MCGKMPCTCAVNRAGQSAFSRLRQRNSLLEALYEGLLLRKKEKNDQPTLFDMAPEEATTSDDAVNAYLDVSGDDAISPIDALLVINALNSPPASKAEAEDTFADAYTADGADSKVGITPDFAAALAIDEADQATRRRRTSYFCRPTCEANSAVVRA